MSATRHCAEANPGIVYCAITGYGQTGPNTARAGHDMNYLGLIGLLGLTGERDGRPIQAAGQIADLGGGALMAAFGVMAALRERERSGRGQLVDVSMTDGALSWLAMVAAQYLRDGEVPQRGGGMLSGGIACYLPYECADGWVTLRRAGAEVLAAFCDERRAPGPDRAPVRDPRLPGPRARSPRSFASAPGSEWRAFNDEHDAMIEPILDLDEALDSELVREREMVVELEQPELGPVRLLGVPVKLSRTPGIPAAPRPRSASTPSDVLREAGFVGRRDRGPARVRRGGGPQRAGRAGAVLS